jgi:putative chitinase
MNIAAAIEELCPAGLKYVQYLEEAAARFNINTRLRAAHWLGQIAHESGEFRQVRENLNYSAEGLMRTWPARFPTKVLADRFAHDPLKIANVVYANRLGNGPETSGDGSRFIGRGLIQITGRANYAEASRAIHGDDRYIYHPEIVEQPEDAALTAGWFWDRNDLNDLADRNDTVGVTKRVNGGTNGLAARELFTERFLGAL